jgi:hypothetical protein
VRTGSTKAQREDLHRAGRRLRHLATFAPLQTGRELTEAPVGNTRQAARGLLAKLDAWVKKEPNRRMAALLQELAQALCVEFQLRPVPRIKKCPNCKKEGIPTLNGQVAVCWTAWCRVGNYRIVPLPQNAREWVLQKRGYGSRPKERKASVFGWMFA